MFTFEIMLIFSANIFWKWEGEEKSVVILNGKYANLLLVFPDEEK